TDAQVEADVPDRAGAGDQYTVVAAGGVVAYGAIAAAEHPALIADHQTVADTGVTDVQTRAIAPDRAGAGDQHTVVVAAELAAHEAVAVEHDALVADHQTVANTGVADAQIHAVAPD